MSNTEYTPSHKVAAMLAALAKKYKRSPLDDATLNTMCTVPEEQWPPELAGKVEALLKSEPKPAGGKPVVEVKAFKITFTMKVGDLQPAPEPIPNCKNSCVCRNKSRVFTGFCVGARLGAVEIGINRPVQRDFPWKRLCEVGSHIGSV